MVPSSIGAYDLPRRVASYDADMDVMHPNRHEMVRAALEFLPFPDGSALVAIDLGVGTGYFAARFLERYPRGRVIAVDGASAMIDLARARLGDKAVAVEFRVADFRQLEHLDLPDALASLRSQAGADAVEGGPVHGADVVLSSYALHHLDRADKLDVVRQAAALLRPGGWLLNADIVVAESAELEERIQRMRVEGIVKRAGGADARFLDAATTRAHLDRLEAEEGDQPLTVAEDLAVLRAAGLCDVGVVWLEHREAVTCGRRPSRDAARRPGEEAAESMRIRPLVAGETDELVALWERCGLTRPWNDPRKDVARKLALQDDLLLVGVADGRIVAAVMAGYEGHRGWVNYLAVEPRLQGQGLGRRMMGEVERRLSALGCPKVSLLIRRDNDQAAGFYRRLGYVEDDVLSMGRRLEADLPQGPAGDSSAGPESNMPPLSEGKA